MTGRPSVSAMGPWPAVGVVVLFVLVTGGLLLGGGPGSGAQDLAVGPSPYVLPASAFNITDHNLTYATNGFLLSSVVSGSYSVSLTSTLIANSAHPLDQDEAQIGIGPVPAGPDETNITPLFILQEAANGLLRIEYIPFPMNDTYGYLVYDGFIVPAGPTDFVGHVLTLAYTSTAPPVPAYIASRPYGQETGNLTVSWDGRVIVPKFGLTWSTFGALYAYGLETDGFVSGAVYANVTAFSGAAVSVDGGSAVGGPGFLPSAVRGASEND